MGGLLTAELIAKTDKIALRNWPTVYDMLEIVLINPFDVLCFCCTAMPL